MGVGERGRMMSLGGWGEENLVHLLTDRKKYLGRGQLGDTAWHRLDGNDVINSNIQSYPHTRENHWQILKSL